MSNKQISKNKMVMSAKAKRTWFILLFSAWPVLHWCVFYLATNVTAISMAFQWVDPHGQTFWSLKSFERIFSEGFFGDGKLLEGVKNTLIFFVFGQTVMQMLNWFISYFLYKKIAGYKIFRFIFYLPAVLPGIAIQTVFRRVIESGGVLSEMFASLGWAYPDLLSQGYAMKTLLAYQFITGWTGFIVLVGMLRRIPAEVVEAAELDGVTPLREWFQILFPMVWPMIAVEMVMSVLGIFQANGAVLVFTQGREGTYTIAYWMFENVYNENINPNYTAAAGIFFTALACPLLFFTNAITRKVEVVEY